MSSKPLDITTDFHIPRLKPPPKTTVKGMPVSVTTYPPLGQVTQLRSGKVAFTAVLETESASADAQWQVALWHSTSEQWGGEWTETVLTPSGHKEGDDVPSCLGTSSALGHRLFFIHSLEVETSLSFTVKVRAKPDDPWRWIRDESGLGDGSILVSDRATADSLPSSLGAIFKDLNPDLHTAPLASQAPATLLWSVQATVPAAKGEESVLADIPLGIPWRGDFIVWFALVRPWTPWLAPRQGKTDFAIDRDALLCSFLSREGKHVVILAVCRDNDVMPLLQSGDGNVVNIRIRNDGEGEGTATILVAVGNEFEPANAAVMYHARTIVSANAQPVAAAARKAEPAQTQAPAPSRGEGEVGIDLAKSSSADDTKASWYMNWYDGLGFCTWNALGQRLTDEKVIDAVDQLSAHKIKISTLIIDDNWQSIDYNGEGQWQHRWNDFEAEPNTFPQGLKTTLSYIRLKYPHIKHIAMWHAILGYWGGINPEGRIGEKYKIVEVMRADGQRRNLPWGGPITVVAPPDVSRFYDDFYRFLGSCGVDGVKTDGQFMLDLFEAPGARRSLIRNYLDAWTVASLRHFGMRAISCMSQIPQAIFHSHMARTRPVMLCRNSDDFFPQIADSHPWHIWSNAHNSLLTQHLNVLPDWDMFQTVHDYSGFHAAARCVSGGPIYITDEPGRYNLDLIRQMTATTTQGETVVLRPSVLGRSLDQYVAYSDNVLLKVGSYHGMATTGTPLLAVFNVSSTALGELVPLARFLGVVPSLHYVVRAHTTGKLSSPVQIGSRGALLNVKLAVRGYEVFAAFPLSIFNTDTWGPVFVASLGLVGKMTGAAAIVASWSKLTENGRLVVETRLKAMGVLGIYISALEGLSVDNDFMVTILEQPVPRHTVRISEGDKHVLEIDVEKAWTEMGLRSGWNNEVQVKAFANLEKEDYVLV